MYACMLHEASMCKCIDMVCVLSHKLHLLNFEIFFGGITSKWSCLLTCSVLKKIVIKTDIGLLDYAVGCYVYNLLGSNMSKGVQQCLILGPTLSMIIFL